jgi:hypothetical protein
MPETFACGLDGAAHLIMKNRGERCKCDEIVKDRAKQNQRASRYPCDCVQLEPGRCSDNCASKKE